MQSYQDIIVEQPAEGVGLIRLNRPQALNALRSQLMQELVDATRAFDADPAIGAVVLTGNEKAFSAGADITEMAGSTAIDMWHSGMLERWKMLSTIRIPLIAAVNGHCLGGGFELAMLCDIILAGDRARFGQPEINIGVIPGAGGTQRLTRAVGKSLAMEVILNDRRITAEEALSCGLASRVVAADELLAAALELAAQIAARAPLAVQMGKAAINKAFESSLSEGMAFEEHLFYLLFSSQDQTEGMQAFVEKRKPNWQGR